MTMTGETGESADSELGLDDRALRHDGRALGHDGRVLGHDGRALGHDGLVPPAQRPPSPHVTYLTVPSARHRAGRGHAKEDGLEENTTTTTTPLFPSSKPIPTFGVGKAAPRGFPSLAMRTRLVGGPSQVRRGSLTRTKSLGDDQSSGANSPTTQEGGDPHVFNPQVVAIPTLFLPSDSEGGSEDEEEEDASDLVTIPSSYMLPSVQGLTDVRSVSDQGSQVDSGHAAWRGPAHLQPRRGSSGFLPRVGDQDVQRARRGSSVSVVFGRPEMPTMLREDGEDQEEEREGQEQQEQGGREREQQEIDGKNEEQEQKDYSQIDQENREYDNKDGEKPEPTGEKGSNSSSSKTILQQDSPMASGTKVYREQAVEEEADNPQYRPFVPPPDVTDMLQGFVDPLTSYRHRLARRKRKQMKADYSPEFEKEDNPDPLDILRDSMNRIKKRESRGSQGDGSVSEKVTPLTLVSVQRQHILTTRPAFMQTSRVAAPRPDHTFWDPLGGPQEPGQEIGTGYLSLEKFSFVCEWVRTVEQLREKGLLDGDRVTEMDLMWSFGEDYVPNQTSGKPKVTQFGDLLHRGSI